jgi:hypothetical protein
MEPFEPKYERSPMDDFSYDEARARDRDLYDDWIPSAMRENDETPVSKEVSSYGELDIFEILEEEHVSKVMQDFINSIGFEDEEW